MPGHEKFKIGRWELYVQYITKGDGNKCDNYRGITLLSCICEVQSSIISNRVRKYAEKIISDYQYGFWTNRETVDNIHILRSIIQVAYKYN